MLLISIFHLAQSINDDAFYSCRPIFVFPDCFSVLSIRTNNDSYQLFLSQDDFPLSQNLFFSPFQMICYCYSSLVLHFALIVSWPVSHFVVPSCTSKMPALLLKDASGFQAGRHFVCQYLSRGDLLCNIFPLYSQVTLMAAPIISLK